MSFDERAHNRAAWDLLSRSGDRWTIPVTPAQIAAARRGEWSVQLTNSASVPADWFRASDPHRGEAVRSEDPRSAPSPASAHSPRPPRLRGGGVALDGWDILALASGGGQQGPLFAAAGARVTVLDNSREQLAKDAMVAKRESLELRCVEGTMEDLSVFPDASFDLVFNPASVLFTRDVRRVWREAARVLRPGGTLMAGFLNPATYLFDRASLEGDVPLLAKYTIPYTDEQLPPDELQARVGRREPLEFSHTLTDLVGGQLDAGLHLVAMYEDVYGDTAIDAHFPPLLATRAIKPR